MTQANSLVSGIKQIVVFLVFIALALFISRQINSWLGKRAIENTGLISVQYHEALEASRSTGKPVLLKFAAVWCGACRQLDNRVFTVEAVKKRLQNDIYYVRLDYDNNDDNTIFSRYGVRGFPTLKLVDGDGKVLSHLATPATPEALLQQLDTHMR